jgi:PPP family 3-phenylpropionic acid transporter
MAPATRNLSTLRFYYLLLGVGGGFLSPFITLFYKQQGLSGTQIGLLATFAGMAALVAAPLWGRLSDAAAHPRRWLQVELVASCACLLLLSQQSAFIPIALFVVLNALVNAGSSPSSDALVMTVLNKIRSGFGSVRLFASLGWAIAALLSGWLIEQIGLFVIFIGYVVGYASGAGAVNLIRLPPRSVSRTLAQQPRLSIRSALRDVLHSRRLRGLAVALVVFGFMMYGLRSFEALYLKQLDAPSTIVGLMSTIGATVELPGMLWADRLVRRYGAARVLRFSFTLEVMRLCGVLLVPAVPTLLLMRAVGGISVSWYVVSVLGFIYESVPEQRVTTTLALFNVTLPAIINMVAAPTSGFIFDRVGGYWLYALGAIGSAVAWLVMRTMVKSNPVTSQA